MLLVDEAYIHYSDAQSCLDLVAKGADVLVTRTFSKIYGLAGERIGWATGAPGLVATLNRIRLPFNASSTGQAMALAALGDQAFVESTRLHNAAERAHFAERIAALGNHGLRPLPSEANFVMVLFEGALSAEAAYEGLMQAGYIVRWLPGQGLPQGLRITIGTREQMDAIADALTEMADKAR